MVNGREQLSMNGACKQTIMVLAHTALPVRQAGRQSQRLRTSQISKANGRL